MAPVDGPVESETKRGILVGVVTWVITQVLLQAWNLIVGSSGIGLVAASGLSLALVAVYLVLPTLVAALVALVYLRRRRVYEQNLPTVFGFGNPPMHVYGAVPVDHFGVLWSVEVGDSGAEPFGYHHGPFCPKDGYKLDSRVKPSLLGSERNYWRCASCGAEYPRPREDFRREAEVVEKLAVLRWLQEHGPITSA